MSTVETFSSGRTGRIRLNRVEKRNALSQKFVDEIIQAIDDLQSNGIEIAVLEASAPVFCAGVDLSGPISTGNESPELRLVRKLLDSSIFFVCSVDGPVIAGGMMLLAVSPLVIASDSSEFWLPEKNIGIFPGRVLAYLEQLNHPRDFFTLGLSGKHLSASEARDLGVVSLVVPAMSLKRAVDMHLTELERLPAAFVQSARKTWQSRFRSSQFLERSEVLDDILIANLESSAISS